MTVEAKLKYLRQSPRKVRLAANVIRGLDVEVAQEKLRFINKKAAAAILRLLDSSIANAENNFELKKNNLIIKEIKVNEGSTLKRWMPRAFGRASAINKRTSHINIILEEKIPTLKKEDKKEEYKMDTKVVKSLDELDNKEDKKGDDNKEEPAEVPKAIQEKHRHGLDKLKGKKDGKGWKAKVFNRKSG